MKFIYNQLFLCLIPYTVTNTKLVRTKFEDILSIKAKKLCTSKNVSTDRRHFKTSIPPQLIRRGNKNRYSHLNQDICLVNPTSRNTNFAITIIPWVTNTLVLCPIII